MPIMKPADLGVLQDELTNDPLGRGYATTGPVEVADDMNAPTGAVTHARITLDSVMDWLVENGKYGAIKTSADAAATRFMAVAGEPHITTLNPANPDVEDLFTDLRNAGLLTNPDLTALQALAEGPPDGPSRAETLFGWPVYPENIEQAREAA